MSAQFLVAAPILENPDGYGHYLYIETLARQGHFPRLDELPSQAGGEAGQFPLYYMLGAALVLPFPDADLSSVAIPNPHGPRQADDNPNVLFHKPFQGFPHGAELAVRIVEALSIACGVTIVVCTVLLARLWAPGRPWLWLAAGLLPAANPAFAYLSASVTNDMLVAALSSVAILLLSYWLARKPGWASWASAIAVSLAILAKFNAVGLIPVYLVVLLVIERAWLPRLVSAAKLLLALLVVDGWWMVRNALLYGDPTAVVALNRHYLGTSYTALPSSWPERLHQVILAIPDIARSFLAMFGRYVITAHYAYPILGVAGLLGLLAGTLAAARRRHGISWLLLAWTGLMIAETIGYAFSSISGGRFLYPALAPMAVLVAIGWAHLLGFLNIRALAAPLVLIALGISASCAWLVVKPAYAYAPTLAVLPSTARPVQATFDGAVELIGVDTPTDSYVSPGQPVPITLYWRLSNPVDRPLSEFLHVDSGDPAYSSGVDYEGAPGAGLDPPNFWQTGQIVVDRHSFVLPPDRRPDRRNAIPLHVHVGMYYLPPTLNATVQPVPVQPAAAAAQGFEVAALKISGAPVAFNASPLADFGELTLQQASAHANQPSQLTVNLQWHASNQPTRDYTMFVQALSASGTVIAQHDSYPLNGRYPTSAWSAGEQVSDTTELTLARAMQPGDSVIVGIYALPSTQPIPTSSGRPSVQLPISS